MNHRVNKLTGIRALSVTNLFRVPNAPVKQIFKFLFLISLFWGYGFPSAMAMTWHDYELLLLEKNVNLQSSHWTVTANRYAREAIGATAWPVLSFSTAGSHTDSTISSDLFSYSLVGTYTLFDGGAIAAKIHSASVQLEQVQLDEIKNWINLRNAAKLTYIEATYSQTKIKLLNQILERLKRNENFMKVKFEGGQQPRWVYLSAKNSRLAIEQQLKTAQRDARRAQKQLAVYLGKNVWQEDNHFESLNTTVNVDLNGDYQNFISANIDVLKAQKNIENFQALLDVEKANLWPLITLRGSSGLSGTPAFFPSQTTTTLGLNLSLSLFDANVRQNNIAQREAQISSAQLEAYAVQLDAAQNILSTLDILRDDFEKLPLSQESLSVAQERLETTEELYLAGRALYLEWDQAQQTLTNAQLTLLDSQYQLNRAMANFEKALQLR